jgi:hypothetical protein
VQFSEPADLKLNLVGPVLGFGNSKEVIKTIDTSATILQEQQIDGGDSVLLDLSFNFNFDQTNTASWLYQIDHIYGPYFLDQVE